MLTATYRNLGYSPWGAVQTEKVIGDGVRLVTTSSHGGFLVTEPALSRMPAILKAIVPWAGEGAYEEDVDWAIVILAFPHLFSDSELSSACKMAIEYDASYWGGRPRRYVQDNPAIQSRVENYRRGSAAV